MSGPASRCRNEAFNVTTDHSARKPRTVRTTDALIEHGLVDAGERDAIDHVRDLLLTGKHASEDDLKAIDKEIKAVVNDAAEFSKESPEPALEELWTDIYADA